MLQIKQSPMESAEEKMEFNFLRDFKPAKYLQRKKFGGLGLLGKFLNLSNNFLILGKF